jgi:hypothetical protein
LNRLNRLSAAFCLLAALVDGATGSMLLAAPLATLRLMGIRRAAMDPVGLRFIGSFVLGVGLAYLLPFLRESSGGRRGRLIVVFEVTALIRFLVGSFVAVSVLSGQLETAWASVAVTDLGLAVLQLFWRRKLLKQGSGDDHG